jgi:hypothetical protein
MWLLLARGSAISEGRERHYRTGIAVDLPLPDNRAIFERDGNLPVPHGSHDAGPRRQLPSA